MQIFIFTPEIVAEVRHEGLTGHSVEDLVKMRIFNMDGEFISQAKAGLETLDIAKLVQKRIGVHGK